MGEGSEKLGALQLIKLVAEFVFSSVQVFDQLQLGYGVSHQYLQNQIGIPFTQTIVYLNKGYGFPLCSPFRNLVLDFLAATVYLIDACEDALSSEEVADGIGDGFLHFIEYLLHFLPIFGIFLRSV